MQNLVSSPALVFKRVLQVESGELVVVHREREIIRRTIGKRVNMELEERWHKRKSSYLCNKRQEIGKDYKEVEVHMVRITGEVNFSREFKQDFRGGMDGKQRGERQFMGFGFTWKGRRMDLALEKGNKRTKWESAGGAEESGLRQRWSYKSVKWKGYSKALTKKVLGGRKTALFQRNQIWDNSKTFRRKRELRERAGDDRGKKE